MSVWSRYNYLLEREGVFMLFNSLTNSFAELAPDLYEALKGCKSGERFEAEIDEATRENLIKMKAIVKSDERERLRIKYKVQMLRFMNSRLLLTICPTLGCNFRCGYCFERNHPDTNMTDEAEASIISFIKKHPQAKSIGVTWFGGEPLMQFGRMVSLTEKMLALEIPYGASLITNGYLLDEAKVRRFKEMRIGSVQITLDGLRDTHDRRRFLKGGGPTYDRIISNIAAAADIAPELAISIRVNIDAGNADDYILFHDFIRSQGWKNVHASPAFVGDYSEGNCGYVLGAPERRKLLEKYADATGQTFAHFYPGGGRSECAIRNPNTYVIGPEGEIYKCWNDVADPDRVVGYVDGRITNEELLLDYMSGADPLESAECNDCLLFPVCTGGCPYERLRNSSQSDICPLFKSNIDDFLWKKYLKERKPAE